MNDDLLSIKNYVLSNTSEIKNILEEVQALNKFKSLIHISSFLHNTVLVHTLKKELSTVLPESKIILLKDEDKTRTTVKIFTSKLDTPLGSICDEILKAISLDSVMKENHIKNYRNQLFSRYFTDHLTSLPNIYQLRKDLEEHTDSSLVIIKIDNFKTINNFYGFIVGDYVIEEIGKNLKEIIKEYKIYKLSGNEFALTLNKNLGFYELKEYLSQLYETINSMVIRYQNIDIYIDFTLASSSHEDSQDIFSKVSMALQHAKELGVAFWIYEDRMNLENEYERNLKLSGLVRNAIDNSNILPYFQAIIDNKTSKIVKYECLARLLDSKGKVLSPIVFIPIAKKIKAYTTVTKTIIEKSFATFEDSDLEFNINLSIEDIMNPSIFTFIIKKLQNSNASSRVTFELLESEAIQDFKKVERFISEVKRYGSKIAIDDFGSGYSNFFYLTKMKPDYIKIDGSLIENIDVDKNSLIVVETIVLFAKKLGIKTVAEYVHSSVVMDVVKSLGIDYSQGFYIDEPSVKFVES